jgi:hypothetical protein
MKGMDGLLFEKCFPLFYHYFTFTFGVLLEIDIVSVVVCLSVN